MRDAGVVDDDVDAAERFGRRAHHGVDVDLLRDVALHGMHLVAVAGSELAHALAVDVGGDDLGAFEHETLGNGAPEPGGGAGDDRDLADELHVDLT